MKNLSKIILSIIFAHIMSIVIAIPCFSSGLDFDPSKPLGTESISTFDDYLRETRADIIAFAEQEHGLSGIHSLPATTTAGLADYSPTSGRLIYNTTTGALLWGNGSAWVGTNGAVSVYYASISNYGNSLTTAVATIGATPTTLLIDSTATLSAGTVVPTTMELYFVGSGQVTLGNFNLTLNCSVRGPPSKIFNYSGGGVVLRGATGPGLVFADWFGAVGDGATNDRTAVVNAYLYHSSYRGTVAFYKGKNYVVRASETTIPQNVDLSFFPGSKITIYNSNLILNSSFSSSSLQQVFSLAAAGVVKRGSTGQASITPEAFGSGVASISAAISYFTDFAGDVVFSHGDYGITSALASISNSTLVVKSSANIVVTAPATLTLGGRVVSERPSSSWHSGTGTVIINSATFSGYVGDFKLPYGTYSVPVSATVPTTTKLICDRGATLSIATGVVLTINGSFEAGSYKVFDLVGTGVAAYGPNVQKIFTAWYGDDPTKVADSVPAIQQAFNASNSGGYYQKVVLGPGSFKFASKLVWKPFVQLEAQGASTKIYPTAIAIMIDDSAGDINPATGGQSYFHMVHGGFDIYGEDNGQNLIVFNTTQSLLSLIIPDINFYADDTYSQRFWYHAGEPVMGNIFGPWFIYNSLVPDGESIYFYSALGSNGNILQLKTGGGGTAAYLVTAHNWSIRHFQNTPPVDRITINAAGYVTTGKNWAFKITGFGNSYEAGSWFETSQAFLGLSKKSTDQSIVTASGYYYADDALDRNFFDMLHIEGYPITPTFVSADQITWVSASDLTGDFATGRHMLWKGANGIYGSNLVLSSTYIAGTMTVNRNTTTTGPAFPADISELRVQPQFKRINSKSAYPGYSVQRDMIFRESLKIGDSGPKFTESGGILTPSKGGIAKKAYSATYANPFAPDLSNGTYQYLTVTGAMLINPPTNCPIGTQFTIEVIQDAVGGYAITFDGQFKHSWSDTGNTANKRSTITFIRRSSVQYVQVGSQASYF